jgi:peptide/nickel transport system substrate-binding protein
VPENRGTRRHGGIHHTIRITATVAVLMVVGSCRGKGEPGASNSPSVVLRVGVAQFPSANQVGGLRQFAQIQAIESLARTGEADGRMQPSLAESWTLGADGRALTVSLRPGIKFSDGSPLDSTAMASMLPAALRGLMGAIYSDIDHVRAVDARSVEIGFHEPAPFLLESLEAPILKQIGTSMIGTGPFSVAPNSKTELRANRDYYLGPPAVDVVQVESYPSVRTAWAEMLRDRLDMLYEVGSDALESMKNSSTVSVFTFTRRYQHVITLNSASAPLRSAEIRRALNQAVNRGTIVQSALNTYGIASSGPIWPRYWAMASDLPSFGFEPKRAAEVIARSPRAAGQRPGRLRFTCLVPPDSLNERIALEVKRQLEAVGVDMMLEETAQDQMVQRAAKGDYETMLIEVISGPTILRPYLIWHSKGQLNWGRFGNATIDAALDRVRHAPTENDYRLAVSGMQKAFMDDPPAIFLAWSVRARAVSNRFMVPKVEPGRDLMSTLRLWKPAGMAEHANRN